MKEKLEASKFIFAKSMPNIPHEYTLRKWWDDQDFEKAVLFIRENGVKEKFFSKVYIYYYTENYKYWTMGAPAHETILINRARLNAL